MLQPLLVVEKWYHKRSQLTLQVRCNHLLRFIMIHVVVPKSTQIMIFYHSLSRFINRIVRVMISYDFYVQSASTFIWWCCVSRPIIGNLPRYYWPEEETLCAIVAV